MLKLKYLFENFQLAKYCLSYYEYSDKNLDKLLNYYRISSNAIYPFYSKDESTVCFLRLSPVEEKTIDEVASEIHFIDWLIAQGYPAMKPYPMKNGRLFDVLDTPWGSYNASCFQKVLGQTLENTDGNIQIAYGYGKALGQLHYLSQKYPYTYERKSLEQFLAEIKNRLDTYRAPETILKAYTAVTKQLATTERNEDNFGLVHYDFEPDNVLYDEETKSFGVIDFDDSIQCWYALDVVRAIDAMDDVVEESMKNEAIDAFIEGYRSVKSFSPQQQESLPLMRKLVNLQSYATILHVLSEPIDEQPDWMIDICRNLHYTLQKIEEEMK